jgi:serine protease AprX
MTVRRITMLAAGVACSVATLAVAVPPSVSASAFTQETPAATTPAGPTARYIVRITSTAGATSVAAALRADGVRVVRAQPTLDTVVVEADAAAVARLRTVPGVLAVAPDRKVKTQSLGFTASAVPGAMTNVTRITGANTAWTSGATGSGVDVALIDTGVAPVSSLKATDKVVVGPDLSFESQNPNWLYLDTYGHGTHMASIIGGREVAKGTGSAYAADTTNFYGMAPDSRILSLKLADNQGAVDVSQVIAAVDWVNQYKNSNGWNIKVLNISFGTESTQSPASDPLAWAAECAWKNGIVVVASAGNDGGSVPGLANPAYSPWVLAVGAADTKGTDAMSDDVVPAFSARQGGNFGNRPVDIVAPGVSIAGQASPGSAIWNAYPSARIGNGFIKGSGTSQAAAVVSGAVADLLQKRPTLTPNQVKALLKATATVLPGQATAAQGSGELNLAAALTATVPTTLQAPTDGNGNGSMMTARNWYQLSIDGVYLSTEKDIMGTNWIGTTMAAAASSRTAWSSDGKFNGVQWLGTAGYSADTTSWAGKTWQGKTWQGKTWQGNSWSGKTWQGKTWQNLTWTSSGWSAGAWASIVDNTGWASNAWSGAGWG